MNPFDDQLAALDEQLEAYEPMQRWFIYIVIALSLMLMSWMFFTADMIDELSTLQEQTSALESKITQNSPQAYQAKITHINKALLKGEAQITDLASQKEILTLQMSQSQGLLFDNRQYAIILDRLLERSVSLGLKVQSMQSDDMDKKFYGKVKQYKILKITGSGNFRSIAAFLAFIEEQKSLTEVENVIIRSNEEKPSFDITVKYMGVAL